MVAKSRLKVTVRSGGPTPCGRVQSCQKGDFGWNLGGLVSYQSERYVPVALILMVAWLDKRENNFAE